MDELHSVGFGEATGMTSLTSEIDLSRVTAISFDGDETLWDFRCAMRDALELTLRQE